MFFVESYIMGNVTIAKLVLILLPVLLLMILGFIMGRFLKKIDITLGSKLVVYLFIPALIISNLRDNPLKLEEMSKFIFVFFLLQVFIFITVWILHSRSKLPRKQFDSRLLLMAFSNCGSYGMPVIAAAFGPKGLILAVQYMILFNLWLSTAGIYLASGEKMDFKRSVQQILKVPLLYSFVFGVLYGYFFQNYPIILSNVFVKSFDVLIQNLHGATLPFFTLVVGMELSRIPLKKKWSGTIPLVFDKLLLIPILSLILLILFPYLLSGLPAKVMILQTAMPSAFNTMLLTKELKGDYEKAASTVFLTTLASPLTISLIFILVERYL
jgi:predicted permease